MSSRGQNHNSNSDESLSLTSALRECLASGVLVVDHHGHIVSCTPVAERCLGWQPNNQSANGSPASLPPELLKIVREASATKRAVSDRTLELEDVDKNSSLILASAIPIQTGSGALDVVVVLNDVTVAQRLEQNMRRLDRLANIGTLSASMGHEIKNALVAVKTFIDLLLEKNRDAELTEVVRREMRRIDSIVAQMLKFAAPARPAFAAVHLHDVLDHSLRMVQHQLDGKLISLSRSFKATPDAIKGDDYQLEQAFVNLFLNAVEAMGPNGALTVATELVPASAVRAASVKKNSSHVRICVSDTGVGVPQENMSRLFEPFFTTKHNGTGLGLPITRRIVKEHLGDITVHSEPNKGTTFSILLPASGRAQ